MRPSRIALPILLAATFAACAGNAGAAASASAEPAAAPAPGVTLLNRAQALRWMQREYPALLRDAQVTGEVIVRVTLDVSGRVAEASVLRTTHEDFRNPGRHVASRLQFSPPAAAERQLTVRLHFAPAGMGLADVSITG